MSDYSDKDEFALVYYSNVFKASHLATIKYWQPLLQKYNNSEQSKTILSLNHTLYIITKT